MHSETFNSNPLIFLINVHWRIIDTHTHTHTLYRVTLHIRSATPGFVVSVQRLCGFRWGRFRGLWCPCVEWSSIAVLYVLYWLAWAMRCCVAVYGMSGCNPASHKICKNNAITMTVYKVPGVNILVKVGKKKKINIMTMFYFFPFVTFLSDSVVSMPEKPNILEIRYISVQ